MPSGKNISPEIEAAIAEGRLQGLQEAARYVAGLKEERVPWMINCLSSAFHGESGPDGWAPISDSYRQRLQRVSAGILRLINGDPIPDPCAAGHMWSMGDDPVCAMCGIDKNA